MMIRTFLFRFIGKDGKEDSVTFCAFHEEGAKQLFVNWCISDENLAEPYKIMSIETVYDEDDAKEYGDWYAKPDSIQNNNIPFKEDGSEFGFFKLNPETNDVELCNPPKCLDFLATNEDDMREAQKHINDYCLAEFKNTADFSDLKCVGLAHTTVYNEELFEENGFPELSKAFELQVCADLVRYELITYIDGDEVCSKNYSSLREMNEKELENLCWDNLIDLDDNSWNEVLNREVNKASAKAIDEYEAEYGADGRRIFPHLNDEKPA